MRIDDPTITNTNTSTRMYQTTPIIPSIILFYICSILSSCVQMIPFRHSSCIYPETSFSNHKFIYSKTSFELQLSPSLILADPDDSIKSAQIPTISTPYLALNQRGDHKSEEDIEHLRLSIIFPFKHFF